MEPSKFKSARLKLRLTQFELARLLGVKELTVGRWENGTCRIPYTAAALVETMRLEKIGRQPMPMRQMLFAVR